MSKPIIKFGVPHYWPRALGGVEPGVEAFIQRLYQCKNYEILPKRGEGNGMQGTVLGNLRNHLVAQCQRKHQTDFPFDYYLTMDADTWYPGDPDELLDRLIAYGQPVVSAAYPYRPGVGRDGYVAGWWKAGAPGAVDHSVKLDRTGLIKVDWVGGGCCLIRADVFSTLDYPWFRYLVVENGEDSELSSEDMGFALQCREKEIPIYVDCDLVCIHRNTYGKARTMADQPSEAIRTVNPDQMHQRVVRAQMALYEAQVVLTSAVGAYIAAVSEEQALIPILLNAVPKQQVPAPKE